MTLPIPYAKSLIKEIKQISSTIFEVGGHSVKIQTKKGKSLILCDCDNSNYFGHNQFCVHKLAVIIYLTNKNLNENIDKLLEDYTKYKDSKLVPSVDCYLNDLNNLKRVK